MLARYEKYDGEDEEHRRDQCPQQHDEYDEHETEDRRGDDPEVTGLRVAHVEGRGGGPADRGLGVHLGDGVAQRADSVGALLGPGLGVRDYLDLGDPVYLSRVAAVLTAFVAEGPVPGDEPA
jgi:hypothetical protein